MECIRVQGLTKRYTCGDETVYALRDVSFTVQQGEWVTIVGQSGSGKSTLMHLLGCLDRPTAGEYQLMGENTAALRPAALAAIRNRRIGFVFQSFHLLPSLTALENVRLPLEYRGLPAAEQLRRAKAALEAVGLADRMGHRPRQMSGGQQQRTAVARALAAQPELLLADEPTGNLDAAAGAQVMALLQTFHRQGGTVLLITHDPSIAAAAPRTLRLAAGRLLSETEA